MLPGLCIDTCFANNVSDCSTNYNPLAMYNYSLQHPFPEEEPLTVLVAHAENSRTLPPDMVLSVEAPMLVYQRKAKADIVF